MENHGFYVPSQFCTRRHYEHRSCHWITILCVFDFYFKQNRWRLCVIWSIPCSGNGTFELARHPLQVIKCFNVNLKDYTIQCIFWQVTCSTHYFYREIIFNFRVIQDAFVDMENMLELMDEPVEVKDVPNALPLMAMKGKIDFRNVSFYYSEDRPILKDLNFTINPGQTFAIVSISTLLDLLTG